MVIRITSVPVAMPTVSRPINRDPEHQPQLPRRSRLWPWALAGIAVGIAVAAFLIFRGNDADFYRANGVAPAADGPGYAPLPVPGDEAPEVTTADPAAGLGGLLSGNQPFIINDPKPTAPAPRAPEPGPIATPTAPAAPKPAVVNSQAQVLADQSPSPEYPADAYRRQEQGAAKVRATVDAQGNVIESKLEVTSRSRSLDRAAVAAVRDWKFKPAIRDGQPVQSDAIVSVEFTLD